MMPPEIKAQTETSEHQEACTVQVPERVYQAIEQTPTYPRKEESTEGEVRDAPRRSEWIESAKPASRNSTPERYSEPAPSKQEVRAYKELLQTPDFIELQPEPKKVEANSGQAIEATSTIESLGKAINLVGEQYLLMADKQTSLLVSIKRAEWYRVRGQLNNQLGALKAQPLLVPLSLKLDQQLLDCANSLREQLVTFGIELKARNPKAIMVMGVPQPLRQQNLQQLIPDLLSYADSQSGELNNAQLADWLTLQITQVKSSYTLSEAIQIISEVEQLWQGQLPLHDETLVRHVDFTATIAALEL